MDKNIAALLREGIRTVSVRFQGAPLEKTYTYVTDLVLLAGDRAVVQVGENYRVVEVVEQHNDLRIEPNSEHRYQWIVSKVDLKHFQMNTETNRRIERTVADAYQANLRRGYQEQVLAGLLPEAQAELLALTQPGTVMEAA